MGGIGKTVLASAFARNQEVRRAFPDGIFFLGFGPSPDVSKLQSFLLHYFALTSDFTLAEGSTVLRYYLEDKRALFILDDIWDVHDALTLIFSSPGSRTIVTTRRNDLSFVFGGTDLQMELPSEAESIEMLADSTGVAVETMPVAAHEVARECGHVPLALGICSGLVRNGQSWSDVRDRLRKDSSRLSD
jgi:hypothetical protein